MVEASCRRARLCARAVLADPILVGFSFDVRLFWMALNTHLGGHQRSSCWRVRAVRPAFLLGTARLPLEGLDQDCGSGASPSKARFSTSFLAPCTLLLAAIDRSPPQPMVRRPAVDAKQRLRQRERGGAAGSQCGGKNGGLDGHCDVLNPGRSNRWKYRKHTAFLTFAGPCRIRLKAPVERPYRGGLLQFPRQRKPETGRKTRCIHTHHATELNRGAESFFEGVSTARRPLSTSLGPPWIEPAG